MTGAMHVRTGMPADVHGIGFNRPSAGPGAVPA